MIKIELTAITVAKFNAANVGTIVRTLPDFANPTPVGPPVINQVTTKIIARPDGGFYLATLTGFPFIEGKTTIYAISTEGVVTPYKTGMSLITDLALDPNTGDVYALQLASFSLQTFIRRFMMPSMQDNLAMPIWNFWLLMCSISKTTLPFSLTTSCIAVSTLRQSQNLLPQNRPPQ